MSKLINKSIIKAMTIGISAVMTFSSVNLGVFAGEDIPQGAGEGDAEKKEQLSTDTQSAIMLALDTADVKGKADTAVLAMDDAVNEARQLGTNATEGTNGAASTLATEIRNNDDANVERIATEETVPTQAQEDGEQAGQTQGEGEQTGLVREEGAEETQSADISDIAGLVEETVSAIDEVDTGIKADVTLRDGAYNDGIEAAETLNETIAAANKLLGIDAEEPFDPVVKTEVEEKQEESDETSENAGGVEASEETEENSEGADAVVPSAGDSKDDDGAGEPEAAASQNGEDGNEETNEAAKEEAKDLVEKVLEQAEIVETADQNIKNATTVEEAGAAIETARGAAASADDLVNDTQAEFDKISADFETAKEKYNQAKSDCDTINQRLTNAIQNYNDLKDLADDQAQAALDEIARLTTDAQNLQNAANTAKDHFNAAGYARIAVLEKNIDDKISKGVQPDFVQDYRPLVEAIMQFHVYGNDDDKEFVRMDWITKSGTIEFADGSKSTAGGDYWNYALITYVENGETKYERVNYKTVDANNRRQNGIVIFDKTQHIEIDHNEVPADVIAKLEATGENAVDHVKVDDKIYVKVRTDRVKEGKETNANGKVVDRYVDVPVYGYFDISEGQGTEDIKIKEENTSAKKVVIGEESDPVYSYSNGQLTKTVTADVTTTTFTGTGLDGNKLKVAGKDLATSTERSYSAVESEFITAFKDKLKDLNDGETIVVGKTATSAGTEYGKNASDDELKALFATLVEEKDDNEEVTGYKVTGTYQNSFSNSVSISGDTYKYFLFKSWDVPVAVSVTDAQTDYNKAVQDELDKYIYKDGSQQKNRLLNSSVSEMNHQETIENGIHWDGSVVPKFSGDYIDTIHYSGSVSYEYQELNTDVVKFNATLNAVKDALEKALGAIIPNFEPTNYTEQIKAQIIADYAAKGKTVVQVDGWNFGAFTANVYYVDNIETSKEYTTDQVSSLDAAKQAFINSFDADTTENVIVSTDPNKTKEITSKYSTFGYSALEYLIKKIETKTNQTIATTVYANVAGESKTEYRNDNWYTGDIILAEYDNENEEGTDYTTTDKRTPKDGKKNIEYATDTVKVLDKEQARATKELRDNVKAAADIAQKYVDLADKAQTAQTKLNEAKAQVEYLKGEIAKLNASIDTKILREFNASLKAAQDKLDQATKDRDDLLERMKEVEKDYDDKIADLTKVVEDDTNTDDQNTQTDEGEATRTSDNQQGADDNTVTDNTATNDNAATDDNANADDNADANDGVADDNAADYENADDGNADGGNADGGAADDGAAGNDGAVVGGNDGAAGGNVGGGAAGGNDGAAADGNAVDGNVVDGNADEGGNGNETETIENEDSALAEGIGDADGNANEGGAGKDSVTIGNEDSALAEGIDTVQTHRKWNWWWLLIVAALTGGTTYGIIKGNQKKKEKANGDSDKKEI